MYDDASLVIVTEALLNYDVTINRPDFQTCKFCIDDNSKGCENQARSRSHRFTGKSKQTITTNLSQLQSTQIKDSIRTVSQPCVVRGAMHSGRRRNAFWYSGKK